MKNPGEELTLSLIGSMNSE